MFCGPMGSHPESATQFSREKACSRLRRASGRELNMWRSPIMNNTSGLRLLRAAPSVSARPKSQARAARNAPTAWRWTSVVWDLKGTAGWIVSR
eukprot:8943137-Lingulodinium_polyedra.AAC.1